ncbi:MAG: hypothetical protein RMK30_05185 [Anaerolineae bacterium]|nr:hypothetical protein [Anaerolineae bacterium]
MLPSSWPRWTIVIISLGIAMFAVVLGLILEPIGQAIAPDVKPTPTLPTIGYARPLSVSCENCHFYGDKLLASAISPEKAEAAFIEPAHLLTPHGRLGCVTCHKGNGLMETKEAAHTELLMDPSTTPFSNCLLCHRSLPDVFPEHGLKAPHGLFIKRTLEGTNDVFCSDCHGAVGHGFVSGKIICSMSECLDCHRARNLKIQLEDCIGCHIGPHDVAQVVNCNTCHTSIETWKETQFVTHPVELVGKHAPVKCFDCHKWPNFRGLRYVCKDCHVRPHTFGSDECEQCHTPEDWEKIKK